MNPIRDHLDGETVVEPIKWRHADPENSHPVDPHYESNGHWTCYACRQPINDAGRAVNMAALREPRASTPPESTQGLHREGS